MLLDLSYKSLWLLITEIKQYQYKREGETDRNRQRKRAKEMGHGRRREKVKELKEHGAEENRNDAR